MLQSKFTYKVKIINPAKKSDYVTRHLHHFYSKFNTIISLYTKLIEELKEQVPNNLTSSIGYFEGQKHSKVSIASDDDLKAMYSMYPSGDITLWCDARSEDGEGKKKRKRAAVSSTYHEGEEEVEDVYKELKEKHLDKYAVPKLRLWARMIVSHLHESTDEPPNVPIFSGCPPKKPREDLTSALSGAAEAFAKVISCPKGDSATASSSPNVIAMSPSTLANVRMKNFEQLRYIKQLHSDDILTDEEFKQQKENILCAIDY